MAANRDEVSFGDVGNGLKIKTVMMAAYSDRGWIREPGARRWTLQVGLAERIPG